MLRTLSLGLSLTAAALLLSFSMALSHIRPSQDAEIGVQMPEAAPASASPILIRIFKRESELELWMRKGDRFELHATYPICYWSGNLGPKEREGDRQAPEGFYSVSLDQLRTIGRHPRSFDIGYPNALDRGLGRSGSYILVHGGCTSIGCFAMTDAVMEEIYQRGEEALRQGQDQIPVHVFPFRMTQANLAPFEGSRWSGFWQNLKEGYDAFEASRLPPSIGVCRSRYIIGAVQSADDPSKINVARDACGPEGGTATAAASPPKMLRWLEQRRMAKSHSRDAASPIAKRLATPRAPLSLGVRPVRMAALASPRSNLSECVRLWTRETRVTQHHWHDICRSLDFSPGSARVRTR